MNTETEQTPRQRADEALTKLKLTLVSTFIPFSQSRNKAEKHKSINWSVTVLHAGRAVLTTDYSAGCGHCPAYKAKDLGIHNSIMRTGAIAHECETGFTYRELVSLGLRNTKTAPILPDAADVFYSLALDSDVLDAGGFEEWAANLGYDTDSRKAESTYRAFLDIALKLRAAIGDASLAQLRAAFQDY